MIAPNTIVGGRYRVTRPLGGGGMKLVYLAEDLRLAARPCALAEMVDTFTSPETQQQAVAAFQREADMLAQLSNEHIPRVFDRFSDQNHHYLVMEFIDGITLEQKLKDAGGKLPARASHADVGARHPHALLPLGLAKVHAATDRTEKAAGCPVTTSMPASRPIVPARPMLAASACPSVRCRRMGWHGPAGRG